MMVNLWHGRLGDSPVWRGGGSDTGLRGSYLPHAYIVIAVQDRAILSKCKLNSMLQLVSLLPHTSDLYTVCTHVRNPRAPHQSSK